MCKDKKNELDIFVVLDGSSDYRSLVNKELEGYNTKLFDSFNQAYYSLYISLPQLIIIAVKIAFKSGEARKRQFEMINDMQLDNILSNIPILFILPVNFDFEDIKNEKYFLKNYIKEPLSPFELRYKTDSIVCASKSALDANPLTKLPGNSSIMESVKNKLDNKTIFSFAYVDIDNFKSYNDKYGFLRGDEVIMMASRLIVNTVYNISKTRHRNIEKYVFIGHIGGDDFILISHPEDMKDITDIIVNDFDKIILSFYNDIDKKRGYIETYDRRKKLNRFPVMSLSVAVIPNVNKRITHYGQISEIASGLKALAKEKTGSNVVLDKRQD